MQSGTGTLTVDNFALFVYALSFVTSFLDFVVTSLPYPSRLKFLASP